MTEFLVTFQGKVRVGSRGLDEDGAKDEAIALIENNWPDLMQLDIEVTDITRWKGRGKRQ